MSVLSGLKPELVFSYFEKLCSVPHGSGNTKRISDLCVSFAKELGLKWRQDAADNVVIWKAGSAGYEDAPPVILQGHIDMVCTKTADCTKNLATEGLDLATDGEWVWAEKTTLGGDNGIAVAMALAILADETLPHPPIEAVFTADEETGMDGAIALDCSDLKGRRMLNLDSEEEGVFTVSCAGGAVTESVLPGAALPLSGEIGYAVELSGLRGGHSGMEIDKGRGNAVCLLGRVLCAAMERIPELRLAELHGGSFHNVICPAAEALVVVPAERAADLEAVMTDYDGLLKNEYAGSDAGVTLHCRRADVSAARDAAATGAMLRVLLALPQGVEAMSADFPGVVQTSLNLGVAVTKEDGLHLTHCIRSNITSQKELLVQRVRTIVEFAGGSTAVESAYPGWQYQRESAFREIILSAYRDLSGKEGTVEATHGGLECGLFVDKIPGLDVVSMGPELHDVHSPRERLSVASTERVYALVCEVLKNCK